MSDFPTGVAVGPAYQSSQVLSRCVCVCPCSAPMLHVASRSHATSQLFLSSSHAMWQAPRLRRSVPVLRRQVPSRIPPLDPPLFLGRHRFFRFTDSNTPRVTSIQVDIQGMPCGWLCRRPQNPNFCVWRTVARRCSPDGNRAGSGTSQATDGRSRPLCNLVKSSLARVTPSSRLNHFKPKASPLALPTRCAATRSGNL